MAPSTDQSDAALLQAYAAGDPSAFETLVTRHIDAVFSSAKRQVSDEHLAQDITQAVFLILSRKARSLGPAVILPAWLHRTTRYCAANALRLQKIRQLHEQKAASMIPTLAPDPLTSLETQEIHSQLDAAINRLPTVERNALILRYFHGRQNAEIAADLGLSLDATTKRIQRAIARLRGILARPAGSITVAAVTAALATTQSHAAPPLFAKSICAAITTHATTPPACAAIAHAALRTIFFSHLRAAAMVLGCGALLTAGAVALAATLMHNPAPPPIRVAIAGPIATPATQPLAAAPASQPATQPTTEPVWRAAFDSVYHLDDGEAVRRIPRPFIPERLDFYKENSQGLTSFQNAAVDHQMGAAQIPVAIFIVWDDRTHHCTRIIRSNDNAWAMESLCLNLVGLPMEKFSMPHHLSTVKIDGDWIIRRHSTADQRLQSLEKIAAYTSAAFTAQKKKVPRNVIVAKGKYNPDDWPTGTVTVALEEDQARTHYTGEVKFFLRKIGNNLGHPVINEWQGSETARFNFVAPAPLPPDLDPKTRDQRLTSILARLGNQLNIQLIPESRLIEYWDLEPIAPSLSTTQK